MKQTLLQPIKVVHVDDDDIFLRCVKDTLELNNNGNIVIAAQFADPRTFLERLPNMDPFDVLLIDYIRPQMNGSELLSRLHKFGIKVPVVSFTSHSFPEYANQLRKDGIKYCLSKNQLKSLNAYIIKSLQQYHHKTHHGELSPNDIELLLLCCENYSRKKMADRLCISQDAVKVRKKLLAQKISIPNDNIGFIKWAVKNGYYELWMALSRFKTFPIFVI